MNTVSLIETPRRRWDDQVGNAGRAPRDRGRSGVARQGPGAFYSLVLGFEPETDTSRREAGFRRAMEKAELRVGPRQATHGAPPLTAVRMPNVEMGRKAMELVLDAAAGLEVGDMMVEDPPRLIDRASTAVPKKPVPRRLDAVTVIRIDCRGMKTNDCLLK